MYAQRDSGIFVRQNMIPQSDLQAEHVFQGGQYIHPGIHQTLATNVANGPFGPKLLQADSSGNLKVSLSSGTLVLPVATTTTLLGPRTDTSTFISGDFSLPAFSIALFTLNVTALSGTSPTASLNVQGKSSLGSYGAGYGGGSTGNVTAINTVSLAIGGSNLTTQSLISALFRIIIIIGGTTPSFTYTVDVTYR